MKETIKNNDPGRKPPAFYPKLFVPPSLAQMENFNDVTQHEGNLLMLPSRLKGKHTDNTLHLPVNPGGHREMQNIFNTKTEIKLQKHGLMGNLTGYLHLPHTKVSEVTLLCT